MKYIRDFVLLFAITIVIVGYSQGCLVSAAESTITMTELYQSGDYDGARKNASEKNQEVTVSSLEEFKMLREACYEDDSFLKGISFVQTEDIVASNIKVSYEELSERIYIEQEGKVTASLAQRYPVAAELFKGKTTVPTTWKDLQLTNAMTAIDHDKFLYFDGSYDGKGHYLQGFLGVNDHLVTDGKCSLFFYIGSRGSIRNVNVEDCLMMGCGVLAYGVERGGVVENCSFNRICIYGETVGSIASCMWYSTISRCTVKNSDFVLKRDYHGKKDQIDSFGNVGGIVGQASGCIIEDCQVTDSKLYGVDDPYEYIGGIVGRTEGSDYFYGTSCIKKCISDVSIVQSYCAGGLIGMQRNSVEINSCLSIAQMRLFSDDSDAGGVVGRDESGDLTIVNTCSIGSGKAYKSGGLIGAVANTQSKFVFRNCLVLNRARGTTYGSLSANLPNGCEDSITYCYVPKELGSYFAEESQDLYNCATVTVPQLTGEEKSVSILQSPLCSDYYSMVELLNYCGAKYEYSTWILSDQKYPVPLAYDNLPDLEQLQASWDNMKNDVNVMPTPTPSNTPMPDPSNTPTPTPNDTLEPSKTPTPTPSKTPTPGNTPTPAPSKAQAPSKTPVPSQAAAGPKLRGMKLTAQSATRLTIRWNQNKEADGIVIYQRTGKGKFRKIGRCNGNKTIFVWKRAKAGKKYTFRIQAFVKRQGKKRYGKAISKQIKMPYLNTPKYRLSVGVNALHQKYMQIALKQYQGSHIEIYLKKEKGRFAKAAMRTNKIAPYKGKIRFTYQKGGATYYCKLRTYRLQKSKKKYSPYSRILKIRT